MGSSSCVYFVKFQEVQKSNFKNLKSSAKPYIIVMVKLLNIQQLYASEYFLNVSLTLNNGSAVRQSIQKILHCNSSCVCITERL